MKAKISLTILICLFTAFSYAQNTTKTVKVGDVFTIAEVTGDNYKHINFPKNNFIVKKGGIADYSKVKGKKVEITSLKEKNGTTVATIKLVGNKRFFNSHKYLTVDIDEALNNKELL